MRTALLPALLLFVGCVAGRFSQGEPFDAELLQELEPGTSTAAEVTELLGPPRMVVDLEPRSAYLYEFSASKVSGLVLLVVNFANLDQRYDRIWLFFDERDVLTHYGAKLSSHRVRWALPWRDLHDPEKSARKDAEREARERDQKQKQAAARKQTPAEQAS